MGLRELALLQEQNRLTGNDTPTPATPDRSLLGDMGVGLQRGLFGQGVAQIGGAMQAFAPVGSSVYEAGKELKSDAEMVGRLPELQQSGVKRNVVGDILIKGAEGVGQMAIPLAVGALTQNPYVAAAASGGIYGGSTYQETKEKALGKYGLNDEYAAANPDDPRVKVAKQVGLLSGTVQGVGDAAMTAVGGKLLKGAVPSLKAFGGALAPTAEKTLEGFVNPSTVKNFMKAWGVGMLGEGVTEAAQDELQAAIERSYGIPNTPKFGEQAWDSAKGGIGTAALLGPLGIKGHRDQTKAKMAIAQTLADNQADQNARLRAATIVAADISKTDKAAAANFINNVREAINNGTSINLADASILAPVQARQQEMITPEEQPAAPVTSMRDLAAAQDIIPQTSPEQQAIDQAWQGEADRVKQQEQEAYDMARGEVIPGAPQFRGLAESPFQTPTNNFDRLKAEEQAGFAPSEYSRFGDVSFGGQDMRQGSELTQRGVAESPFQTPTNNFEALKGGVDNGLQEQRRREEEVDKQFADEIQGALNETKKPYSRYSDHEQKRADLQSQVKDLSREVSSIQKMKDPAAASKFGLAEKQAQLQDAKDLLQAFEENKYSLNDSLDKAELEKLIEGREQEVYDFALRQGKAVDTAGMVDEFIKSKVGEAQDMNFAQKVVAGVRSFARRSGLGSLKYSNSEILQMVKGEKPYASELSQQMHVDKHINAKGLSNFSRAVAIKPSGKRAEVVKLMKDLFNTEVVFVRGAGRKINGMYAEGRIFIDADSQGGNTRKLAMWIAGHEVFHKLVAQNPEAYQQFVQSVTPYMQDMPEYQKRLNEIAKAQVGKEYTAEDANEELLADLMGDMLLDDKFWQHLAADNPSLAQRIMQVVNDILDSLAALFKGRPTPAVAKEFVADMEKVRSLYAKYVGEQAAGVGVAGEVKLSITKGEKNERAKFTSRILEEARRADEGGNLSNASKELARVLGAEFYDRASATARATKANEVKLSITQIPSDDKHGRRIAYMDYMKEAMRGLGYDVAIRMNEMAYMQIELSDKDGVVFLANRYIGESKGKYYAKLSEAVGLREKDKNGKKIATANGAYQPFIRAELRALENIVDTADASLLGHGSVAAWKAEFPQELKDLERANLLKLTFTGQKPTVSSDTKFDKAAQEADYGKYKWNSTRPNIDTADLNTIRPGAWDFPRPVSVPQGGRSGVVSQYDAGMFGQGRGNGLPASESQRIERARLLGQVSDTEIDDALKFSLAENQEYKDIESKYFNPDGTEKPGAMLAPNGKRSNLNKRQWIQVRTESFKKWFGESKVVDENGEPMVMTHGSNAKKPFEKFDLKKTRENSLGQGFYFSDIASHGGAYSGTGIVYSTYLKIENPFVMDWRTDDGRKKSEADGAKIGLSVRGGLWMEGDKKENATKMKKAGYDGVVVLQPETDTFPAHKETVAFSPTQIKSATGNTGEFSPDNPDIRYSLSDTITPKVAKEWLGVQGKSFMATVNTIISKLQPLDRRYEYLKGMPWLPQDIKDMISQMEELSQLQARTQDGYMTRGKQLTDVWMDAAKKHKQLDAAFELANYASRMQLDPRKSKSEQGWDPDVWRSQLGYKVNMSFDQAYEELMRQYKALNPEVRTAYSAVVTMMGEIRDDLKSAYLGYIDAMPVEDEKKAKLKKSVELRMSKLRGAYMPLSRFGQWDIAVYRRNEDGSLGEKVNADSSESRGEQMKKAEMLKAIYPADQFVIKQIDNRSVLRAERNKISEAMLAKMKAMLIDNTNDVAFKKVKAEAKALLSDYAEDLDDDQRDILKAISVAGSHRTQAQALEKLKWDTDAKQEYREVMAALEETRRTATDNKLLNDTLDGLEQIFLETLPESSALKNSMHRRGVGVAGFNKDAIRSTLKYVQRNSRSIAYMKYGSALEKLESKAMAAARDMEDGDRSMKTQQHLNDTFTNRKLTQEEKVSDFARNVNKLGFFWFLTSPSMYVVQNAQPWTISLPYLMAKYGEGKAVSALYKHHVAQQISGKYSDSKIAMFDSDTSRAPADWSSAIPFSLAHWYDSKATPEQREKLLAKLTPEERDLLALKLAIDSGMVANSLTHEGMDYILSGPKSELGVFFKNAGEKLSYLQQLSEFQSRKGVFMAAFDLARKEGKSFDLSLKEGLGAVKETLYDYSGANRPRIISGSVGRILGQFQMFRFQTLSMMVNMGLKAAAGDTQARKQVAYMLMANFMAAGVTGLPFAGTVGIALAAIGFMAGDDDWLREIEEEMMKTKAGQVAFKGMPMLLGLDLSRRIGLGDLSKAFQGEPPAKATIQDRANWYAGKVLGPSYNAASTSISAMYGGFLDGDWGKAIAMGTPRPISSVLQAYQLQDKGLTNSDGRVVIPKDKINMYDVALMSVGVNPADVSITREKEKNIREVTAEQDIKRGKLAKALERAVIAQDVEAIQRASADIARHNQRYPMFAFTSQDLATRVRGALKDQAGVTDKKYQKAAMYLER